MDEVLSKWPVPEFSVPDSGGKENVKGDFPEEKKGECRQPYDIFWAKGLPMILRKDRKTTSSWMANRCC